MKDKIIKCTHTMVRVNKKRDKQNVVGENQVIGAREKAKIKKSKVNKIRKKRKKQDNGNNDREGMRLGI